MIMSRDIQQTNATGMSDWFYITYPYLHMLHSQGINHYFLSNLPLADDDVGVFLRSNKSQLKVN